MSHFWPSSGFQHLRRNSRGWLEPTDDYLRQFLARPELALVEESCAAERALHAALRDMPGRSVSQGDLGALQDADVRENYVLFLRLRDGLLAAGSLEAYYLVQFRSGHIDVPPLFLEVLARVIVHNMLDTVTDPLQLRAAELLFREQRMALTDGRVLAMDRGRVDHQPRAEGLGVAVLNDGNAPDYWQEAAEEAEGSRFALDMTHGFTQELSHGLVLSLAHSRSGLKALSQVLELWVAHFWGVQVRIQPVERIDDPHWRWHIGLDVESMDILNALYGGEVVAPPRLAQIVGLFRLEFVDARDVHQDMVDKPVYLGLAMQADNVLKLKPQNLLVNLPLAQL